MYYVRMVAAFLAVGLLGCHQKQASIPTCFHMNIRLEPMTLDPRMARDSNALTLCRMLFEGLTRISKEGNPELAIAESVDVSSDGLEYTFHLRSTVWSNGDAVTSYDFAESWKQILDPSFPTDIAYQLYVIKNGKKVKQGENSPETLGIETPDPLTLIVRLEGPIPYFLEVCSMAPFFPVPKAVVAKDSQWVLRADTFVGNGPFMLKKWQHTDEIQTKKNPLYWDAKNVSLEEVSFVMVSSDTEMQMFEDHQLDFAGGLLSALPMDAVEHLRESNQLKKSLISGTRFLRINTSEKFAGSSNILSFVECRKALCAAIDRDAISKHLLHEIKPPAHRYVPPEMGLSAPARFSGAEPELANLLFQEIPEEMSKSITLSFIDVEFNRSLAQTIQQQWQRILGIDVELQALESKIFYQKLREKDYQVVLGSWIADFNDPINFLEVFKYKEGGSNNTNWENANYIELLNQSTLCRDPEERKKILREAEDILLADMPIIPLYHEAMSYLQRPGVQDVALSPIGQVDLRWVHME